MTKTLIQVGGVDVIPVGNDPHEVETARVPRAVVPPTADEVEQHVATGHATYRSWCRHCLAGRARSAPHPQDLDGGRIPEMCADFCYYDGLCILVVKCMTFHAFFATALPGKEVSGYSSLFIRGMLVLGGTAV